MKKNAHDTIPDPNEHDRAQAARWVDLCRVDPDRAQEVLAWHISECRWLRNMTHPKSPEEGTE